MNHTIQVLAAAGWAQFVLTMLITLGVVTLGIGGGAKRNTPQTICLGVLLLAHLVLFTFTEVAAADRAALVGRTRIFLLPGLDAVRYLLILDLLAVCILVGVSGGSLSSCFTPLYFFLPSWTIILLPTETGFLWWYMVGTAFAFFVTLIDFRGYFLRTVIEEAPSKKFARFRDDYVPNERLIFANSLAAVIISLMCFYLSFQINTRAKGPNPEGCSAAEPASNPC